MPTWIQVLLSKSDEPLTPLARYTQANGLFYIAVGLAFYAVPGVTSLGGASELAGQEAGLLRIVGMAVAIIGWFYVIGARTNKDSFGLATFADRMAVPLFLVPLALTGAVDPMLVIPFAVLDPLLGIGAFVLWSRQPR